MEEVAGEQLTFKVMFNKKPLEICLPETATLKELRKELQNITGVPPPMQKLMYKGMMKDEESTLADLKVKNGVKILLMGSTVTDVLNVTKIPQDDVEGPSSSSNTKTDEARKEFHKKVIDKGVPEDAYPGILNCHEHIGSTPLRGLCDRNGKNLRLTFKLELDQVWLGKQDTTQKIYLGQIAGVDSEPTAGHPEYHIMNIQMGSTEGSRIYIYWVPAQFVKSIKAILTTPSSTF